MPLINPTGAILDDAPDAPVPPEQKRGFFSYLFDGEAWNAAFQRENSVASVLRAAKESNLHVPDPDYVQKQLAKDIENAGQWDNRDAFLEVQNKDHFNEILGKIQQERQWQDYSAEAGWAGILQTMVAGGVDPTVFIPLVGSGTKLKALVKTATLAAAGATAQEGALQASQYGRSLEESAYGIGAQTILGTILGTFAKNLDKGIAKAAEDMVNAQSAQAIPAPLKPIGVGAEATEMVDPGGIGVAPGIGAKPAKFLMDKMAAWSPVTRVMANQEYPRARWLQAQISDGGLANAAQTRGIATAAQGTAEAEAKTWTGKRALTQSEVKNAYREYLWDGNVPVGASIRQYGVRGKMSELEFNRAVGRATFNAEPTGNAYVDKAVALVRKYFNDVYGEAATLKLVDGDAKLLGDTAYGHRIFDTDMLTAKPNEFIDILAQHYNEKLTTEFRDALEKHRAKQAQMKQQLDDLAMPLAEASKLRKDFLKQLEDMNKAEGPQNDVLDQIKVLKQQQKEALSALEKDKANVATFDTKRKEITDSYGKRIEELTKLGGKPLEEWKARKAELRRRVRSLNRGAEAYAERQASKISKVERLDEMNIETIYSHGRRIGKLERMADRELIKNRGAVKATMKSYLNSMFRLEKAYAKYDESVKTGLDHLVTRGLKNEIPVKEAAYKELKAKMAKVSSMDPEELRAVLKEAQKDLAEKASLLTAKRVRRADSLTKAAQKLDPKIALKFRDELAGKMRERAAQFARTWETRGGNNLDPVTGTADFMEHAREISKNILTNIQGLKLRLPLYDLVKGPTGAEVKRVLDIPSEKIIKFLDTDITRMLASYDRTFGPDIALARKFGDGDPTGKLQMEELVNDYHKAIEDLKSAVDDKGKPLSEEEISKRSIQLLKSLKGVQRDIEAEIARLRHNWGMPDNPQGMAYRMGTQVLNLNALRFLGGTTLSSLSDLARMVQKEGLMTSMKVPLDAFTSGLKNIKLSKRAAQQAGTALDVALHTRAREFMNMVEDYSSLSKPERAMSWLGSKMGLIAGFDIWTSAAKTLTSAAVNINLSKDLEHFLTKTGSAQKNAEIRLAKRNISGDDAARIWKEMTSEGGGENVNGTWYPNTANWKDKQALRAYETALNTSVDNAIITPGLERPLWMNGSMSGKILSQFQSFGMSSVQKTVMAGLQERDMAYANGMMISLALGAVSYYLNAVASGGETYQKMLNAGLDKWADEAIARSGQRAVFDTLFKVAERIPATAPYANFSGGRAGTQSGQDLIGVFGGPSYDLAKRISQLVFDMNEPDAHTAHLARTILPLQNLFYMRQIFDALEGN